MMQTLANGHIVVLDIMLPGKDGLRMRVEVALKDGK
jgi:DNA-binding response OmpR family regulator